MGSSLEPLRYRAHMRSVLPYLTAYAYGSKVEWSRTAEGPWYDTTIEMMCCLPGQGGYQEGIFFRVTPPGTETALRCALIDMNRVKHVGYEDGMLDDAIKAARAALDTKD